MLSVLHQAVGLKAAAATALVHSGKLRSVIVPWDAAIAEFENVEIPRWVAKTNKAFPGLEKLGPLCEGAMVSLCFNRGTAVQDPPGGTRRLEMRNIKALLARGDYAKIPNEFLLMRRLWTNGLVKRREIESKLFAKGLAGLKI
jgi:GH24 family phage-related lysozyme (muramidase)